MFAFQFKLRRAFPTWLFDWLDGIRGSAKRDDKIGVLVLKTPRMPDRDALVVLRWCDWVDLHGPERFEEIKHRTAERLHKRLRKDQQHAAAPV